MQKRFKPTPNFYQGLLGALCSLDSFLQLGSGTFLGELTFLVYSPVKLGPKSQPAKLASKKQYRKRFKSTPKMHRGCPPVFSILGAFLKWVLSVFGFCFRLFPSILVSTRTRHRWYHGLLEVDVGPMLRARTTFSHAATRS